MGILKCILFIGGFGKVGKYVIFYLFDCGYWVVNVDFILFDYLGVDNLMVDIIDSGEMFNVMISYVNFDELEFGNGVLKFDVVVYFVVVLCILINLDNKIFVVNMVGIYNVIEVVVKFGIWKIVIVFLEIIYGVCFVDGIVDFDVLFVEEDYDVNFMDSYGLFKVVNEKIVCVFQCRFGYDIYVFCIGNVIEFYEYDWFFDFFVDFVQCCCNIFCYIDVCDLGQIVDLCFEKDGFGFQVFNVGNDINLVDILNLEILKCFFLNVLVSWEFGDFEVLFLNCKICEVFGFKEDYDWCKYVKK